MVKLRDLVFADIEDYVNWFCTNINWQDFDAPWENELYEESAVREKYLKKYQQNLETKDEFRRSFEIETNDNRHIGWVSSYFLDESKTKLAIGIDIPNISDRNLGYGSAAFYLFIEYLNINGFNELYTQTWSGNLAMIKMATKIGFIEVERIINRRVVNGKHYDALTFCKKL